MGTTEKVSFSNDQGLQLAGMLHRPDGPAHASALFAHCFTCGKSSAAASRIARGLADTGFIVLRFDFTGLGGSDGDFANTNFTSNIQDLLAGARHLREHEQAPALLVGHSLGGTAVLNAALEIPECRVVATIGAPADAQHVSAQFSADIETIREQGEAEVSLAGRTFRIQKQFLDDIARSSVERIGALDKTLLVLHSPADTVVSINEAERIYKAARHPKSFISLGQADHLLTKGSDAIWVANLIASWAAGWLPEIEVTPIGADKSAAAATPAGGSSAPATDDAVAAVAAGQVLIRELDHAFLLDIHSDDHHWQADEPTRVGGQNAGPDPYEHLLAAVGSCTAMTLRMYARRKKWPVKQVNVTLHHSRDHVADCEGCSEKERRLETIERAIEITGELDATQRARLMQIADLCPVHRTLTGTLSITTVEA